MKEKMDRVVAAILTVNLFLNVASFALADEMPNKDDLKNQIIQSAQSASTISADTSAAPQQTQANTSVANTGDNTTTNNTASSNNNTAVGNQNDTDVTQTVNADANTGHNTASGNISINGGGAGIINTGDATVNTTGVVNAGSNSTGISGGGAGAGSNSDVVNTGNNVTTSTSSNSNTTTLVSNGNATTIRQSANVSANTGDNVADGNIALGGGPAGAITTGNASTNTNFLVTAGGNVTLIGGNGGNGPGDGASILLANAGRFGRFNTSANSNHYVVVTNSNRAILSQTCGYPIGPQELVVNVGSCMATTGGNTSNGGIAYGGDAGVINTGDANVNVVMDADANHNTTGVENGNGGANSNTDVVNTGNNVDVNTSSNKNTSTSVNNGNSATVNQTVNAKADTGNNTANGNISFGGRAGVINTGNATVNVEMRANVNTNETGVASGGVGDGSGTGNNTTVVNSGNGVTVNTSSNNNDSTTVNNFNLLNVLQRVWSWVNTGFNSALGNIGGSAGVINTGNATSNTNESVKGNDNCTSIGGSALCITPIPITAPVPTVAQQTMQQPAVGGAQVADATPMGQATQNAQVAAASRSADDPAVGGSVLGAAILPATGASMTVWIFTLSLLSLLCGHYLRNYRKFTDRS